MEGKLPGRLWVILALCCALALPGLLMGIHLFACTGQWVWLAAPPAILLLLGVLAWQICRAAGLPIIGGNTQKKPGDEAPATQQNELAGASRREIEMLHNQINPHFLYNTLDCIRGQALFLDAPEIAQMTEALSAFFRYSISQKGIIVTLGDEIKNVNAYMQIQQYRFENRITLDISMDIDCSPYDLYVPKLILQPIIENSIIHGLESLERRGEIQLNITQTQTRLIVSVADNGVGMTSERLEQVRASFYTGGLPHGNGHGIALSNITKRLQYHFGSDYSIRVNSTLGVGTQVTLTIPALDIERIAPEHLRLHSG